MFPVWCVRADELGRLGVHSNRPRPADSERPGPNSRTGCGGKAAGRIRGKPLLPPVVATAVGARGRFRHRQRRPTRLGRTPIEGAAPEVEPVDRDAILVEATLCRWIYDRVSYQD